MREREWGWGWGWGWGRGWGREGAEEESLGERGREGEPKRAMRSSQSRFQ